jgi:hypothetical protein
MTLALEPVQHGIEHAVGPLQVPADNSATRLMMA